MTTEYEVFEDKMLVLRDSQPEAGENQIILTEEINKPPCTGTVMEAGPDVKNYQKGDSICFTEYAGYFLKTTSDLEEADLIVMREDEVLCKKVEKPEPDAST